MTQLSKILASLGAIVAAAIAVVASPTLSGARHEVSEAPEASGRLAEGVSVSDVDTAGVARLDPGLRAALRRATKEAARDDVHVDITSGWRSADYQRQLLADAATKYGSEREAARWVATPRTSPHVSGDAVDIGPYDAMDWMSRHGSAYGLCQIYGNEPWHYELRPEAVEDGCPVAYADPTQDPRMQ